MARWTRSRAYYGRARAWGSRARSYARRYNQGFNMKYVAGAAIGFVAPTVVPYQDMAMTVMAVLPVKMPYGIRSVAQGYVLGRIAKGMTGINLIGESAGGNFA